MTGEQRDSLNGANEAPAEPTYQLRCATARLEVALQSLDLESETERAEDVIAALRAIDRARDEGHSPRNSGSRPSSRASTPSR